MKKESEINFELLKRLCETPAIAGREACIRNLIDGEMRPLVDELRVDRMGNLIGVRRGRGGRRVMVSAHMDEIGFIVRHIDDKGFLRLHPVGGFDPLSLMSQRVRVHTVADGALAGALVSVRKPLHLQLPGDEEKTLRIKDFFVDLGMSAQGVRDAVNIGDFVTLERPAELVGECVMSKALDDRVGVFVMLEALRTLGSVDADIYAVATVQEEVGVRGAISAAFGIEPDVGIAVDVTAAADVPDSEEYEYVTALGRGAAIKLMDSYSISNPALVSRFKDIAGREGIAYQMEILPRGGTDAGGIQQARDGVPVITLSIPTRYLHTVNETVHLGDVRACIELLAAFLREVHEGDFPPG